MKRKLLTGIFTLAIAVLFGNQAKSQLLGGHGYMLGDYVELAINANGHIGAPCDLGDHCTSSLLGMVANPDMDSWVTTNGDFFAMGSPESGFGLEYTVLAENSNKSNNQSGLLAEIDGSIDSFVDTPDSIIVTWIGTADDLELTIVYELKKDEHFYTTSMSLTNTGVETYTDVYYYRNLDPDINQSIGWGFSTENEIMSQAGMADDSVLVRASQYNVWDAEIYFHAYGENWRGFVGGFANRDASDIWNGIGSTTVVEGFENNADQAIGVAYKIETLDPGKATSDVFSFSTAFKAGVVFAEDEPDTDGLNENQSIAYRIYPNPSSDNIVQIEIDGTFSYAVKDLKGSLVANGQGNGLSQLDFNELEKGIYFIEIAQDNKSAIEKLILR